MKPRFLLLISSIALAVALAVVLSSCGKGDPLDQIGEHCQISADQKGSFFRPLNRYPVTAIADSSFDSREQDSIRDAVLQWNHFASARTGEDLISLKFGQVPVSARMDNPDRDCREGAGTNDTFYILKETSQAHWNSLGLGPNSNLITGTTLRCQSPRVLYRQVIILNAPNHPSFTGIAAHEIGHAIGLDHSCDDKNQGRSDFVSCKSVVSNPNHPYLQAIMFPTFTFGAEKNTIQANDTERAGCLYYP